LLACGSIARAQSGLLEANIVEGDGQVSHAEGRMSRPLIVEVTDETGARIEGAIVSFSAPEDGVSGTFRNGLKTEILITGDDGRVALRGFETGGLAGQFQIRMTVAKGQARSGTVSTQYIAPDTGRRKQLMVSLRPHRRLLEIGALVLAVGAAGFIKQAASAGGHAAAQPPSIGPPTVVIGKP
jgi:hypothetical protein